MKTGVRSIVGYLGWGSFVLLILTGIGLFSWWRWDRNQQVPIPPAAQNVSSEIMGSLAQRTNFAVPISIADVRAFYQQALPERGWSYCGTQATPRCTNLVNVIGGSGDRVDVYRRANDQDFSGTTIEIWPSENPGGGSIVAVFEVNPAR